MDNHTAGVDLDKLIEKLDRVSRWIDKFPVPTDGATAMMCHLRDVKEVLTQAAPEAPAGEGVREQIIADARCILRLLDTVDKLVGSVSGATESIQEHADHIIKFAQKIAPAPAAQQAGAATVTVTVGQLSEPFTLSAATTASASDLQSALDREFPIPDNPHASVIQRAMDDRHAMGVGWMAAMLAVESRRATAPSRDAAPLGGSIADAIAARDAEIADLRAALASAPLPAQGAEHETIVREGDSLVCTACGTAAPAQAGDARNVDDLPGDWKLILDEVARATRKFPTWPTDPLHAAAVLGEEFGELTKAVLQTTYEPHKVKDGELRTEAIQTAAMALRFVASLDRYEFVQCEQHAQAAMSASQGKQEAK